MYFYFLRLFLLFHSFTLSFCSDMKNDSEKNQDTYKSRIAGGYKASALEYPYNVHIFPSHCEGTIIGPIWILSAWRCNAPVLTVLPGVDSIKNINRGTYTVGWSFHHTKDGRYGKEIYPMVLLKLTMAMQYSPRIKPVPIGDARDINSHTLGSVAGFGATETEQRSGQLRGVQLQITPHEECLKKHNSYKEVLSSNPDLDFCAGEGARFDILGGQHTHCEGDYGAGLVVNGTLIGIAVESRGCGQNNPGIYVSVPFASYWLYDIVGNSATFPEGFIRNVHAQFTGPSN